MATLQAQWSSGSCVKCSICASGPGKTRVSCPLSDQRTRYGGPPTAPCTSSTSPSRTASSTCRLRTTIRSPTAAYMLLASCARHPGASRCGNGSRRPSLRPPAVAPAGSKVPAGGDAVAHAGAVDTSLQTSAGPAQQPAPERMRAWEVSGHAGSVDRLRLVERAVPAPTSGEVLVRVRACGVCRTDLHCADGEFPPKTPGVVPGHEVVGEVVALGAGVSRFRVGDRVGVAWLRSTCGECRWCRSGAENLCPRATYTGWDVDGGFAEF